MNSRVEIVQMLAAGFRKTGLAAEIGVKTGDFSRQILENWYGHLYMIDAWRHYPSDVYQDIANVSERDHIEFMCRAVQNVSMFRNRAIVIREESVRAASLFQLHALDWVYIDAAHDYYNVTNDLNAWYPKVRKGGVIWGDDYLDGIHYNSNFGVKTAVNTFFKEKVETNEGITAHIPQWWVIKR